MLLIGGLVIAALSLGSRKLGLRRMVATCMALAVGALAPLVIGTAANAAIVATVPMGTADDFSVLAGSTVTNTGDTTLRENLGLKPGTSVTGFPPGEMIAPATMQIDNPVAVQAKSDLTEAYNNAAGREVNETTAAELGGLTLVGGVYAGPDHGALLLTGPLVLDGQGDPSSVFIIQTDSTLTTASSSTVSLINGAQECNVFWQIGSSATLGTNSVFRGNILALESITVTTGVVVHGRALTQVSAVTLDTNTFFIPSCDHTTTTTAADDDTTTTAAPDDTTTTTEAPDDTTTTTEAPTTTTTEGGTVGDDQVTTTTTAAAVTTTTAAATVGQDQVTTTTGDAAPAVITVPAVPTVQADSTTVGANRIVTVPNIATPAAPAEVVTAPIPTLPKTGAPVTSTLLVAGLVFLLGGVALAFGKMADDR